jgi:hypothetical protein
MKVATCTPVCFDGGPRFFTRDTGLLCRGFQSIGVDCVVIMPGEKNEQEPSDLIRCKPEELNSSQWWQKSGLDLVILYAWGDPRYHVVAQAIRRAGIRLIQSLDTAGLLSPFADIETWLEATRSELMIPQSISSRCRRIARIFRDFVPALFEQRRIEMIADCDLLAAVSPPALESIASYASALGRPEICKKLMVNPHAVSPSMMYQGEKKRPKVLVVGRWGRDDSAQKDPQLTIRVLAEFLKIRTDWEAEIIGPEAEQLTKLTGSLELSVRKRIHLKNFLVHADLRRLYAESRILFCGSRFESFHIASAEAVCCGCSVVVAAHPLLSSTAWFTDHDSGTLAKSRSLNDLVLALNNESFEWDKGNRDPEKISGHWYNQLSAPSVAQSILNLNQSEIQRINHL